MKRLLVVRFPNGTWSYGGKESDPDYKHCEKYWVETNKSSLEPKQAIKIAQGRRSRAKKAEHGN